MSLRRLLALSACVALVGCELIAGIVDREVTVQPGGGGGAGASGGDATAGMGGVPSTSGPGGSGGSGGGPLGGDFVHLSSESDVFVTGIEATAEGGVVVAGYYSGSLALNGAMLASAEGDDGFVLKLTSAGLLQWHTLLAGPQTQRGYDVTVDGAGNVYVVGEMDGEMTVGGAVVVARADLDAVLVKLDGATGTHIGDRVWTTELVNRLSLEPFPLNLMFTREHIATGFPRISASASSVVVGLSGVLSSGTMGAAVHILDSDLNETGLFELDSPTMHAVSEVVASDTGARVLISSQGTLAPVAAQGCSLGATGGIHAWLIELDGVGDCTAASRARIRGVGAALRPQVGVLLGGQWQGDFTFGTMPNDCTENDLFNSHGFYGLIDESANEQWCDYHQSDATTMAWVADVASSPTGFAATLRCQAGLTHPDGGSVACDQGFVLFELTDAGAVTRRTFDFEGNQHPRGLAVAGNGDVIVAGTVDGEFGFQGDFVQSVGTDGFVMRLRTNP